MSGPTLRGAVVEKVRHASTDGFGIFVLCVVLVVAFLLFGAGALVWNLALLFSGCPS